MCTRWHEVTRLAALALLAACSNAATVSGNIPERETREVPIRGPAGASRSALYEKRQQDAPAKGPVVEKLDPKKAVTGIASTHRYHSAGCELLRGAPPADLVPFPTVWDGLDDGYRPCEACRPGP